MNRRTAMTVGSAVWLALGGAGADAAEQVSISQIQGAGHTSPLAGRIVATRGVVTSATGSGFYLQDLQGDGDLATSDAVFLGRKLPQGTGPGAVVEVAGRVTEDTSRVGAPSAELTITKIDGAVVKVVGNGPVPAPVVIGQGGRVPPTEVIEDDGLKVFDPETDGLDFWESLEGMLVRASDLVVVGPSNGFHEAWVLADDGASATGMNAAGGITVAPGDFNPERIQLQGNKADGLGVGDRIDHAVGVIGYTFGNYELLLTDLGTATQATRAPVISRLTKAPDRLLIGSYNVENLDLKVENPDLVVNPKSDVDDDLGRGRFATIGRQIVDGMEAPDIVALQEIQDDDGAEMTDLVTSDATLARLVHEVRQAGGPSYEFVYSPPGDDAEGGQPGGNIRVALLYDPARVQLQADRVVRIEDPAFAATRLPLVAPFRFNGVEVLVVDLHLSSKGGSDPLFGSEQPPKDSGGEQRVAQVQAVRRFLRGLSADPERRLVVLGDMNALQFEPPLLTLTDGGDPQLVNLTNREALAERWSYVFEGNAQALDHVQVDVRSADGAEHEVLHLNSVLPKDPGSGPATKISDHDPTVVSIAVAP